MLHAPCSLPCCYVVAPYPVTRHSFHHENVTRWVLGIVLVIFNCKNKAMFPLNRADFCPARLRLFEVAREHSSGSFSAAFAPRAAASATPCGRGFEVLTYLT